MQEQDSLHDFENNPGQSPIHCYLILIFMSQPFVVCLNPTFCPISIYPPVRADGSLDEDLIHIGNDKIEHNGQCLDVEGEVRFVMYV